MVVEWIGGFGLEVVGVHSVKGGSDDGVYRSQPVHNGPALGDGSQTAVGVASGKGVSGAFSREKNARGRVALLEPKTLEMRRKEGKGGDRPRLGLGGDDEKPHEAQRVHLLLKVLDEAFVERAEQSQGLGACRERGELRGQLVPEPSIIRLCRLLLLVEELLEQCIARPEWGRRLQSLSL